MRTRELDYDFRAKKFYYKRNKGVKVSMFKDLVIRRSKQVGPSWPDSQLRLKNDLPSKPPSLGDFLMGFEKMLRMNYISGGTFLSTVKRFRNVNTYNDFLSLREDWQNVGNDLSKAIQSFYMENKELIDG